MKFIVSTLYKNGKRFPPNTFGKTETGEVITYYSGTVFFAQIFSDDETNALPVLEHAEVTSIQAHGMLITGYECNNSLSRMAQEWWCRPVTKDTQ